MARYQLILAYDGTDFAGFQRQRKARTVQLVVETVLKEHGWQEETILFAGRTDAGVHATGQVIVFSLDWQHEDATLVNALNAWLPADVVVQSIARTEADFHPRYDASSRIYQYHIYQLPQDQPLLERYAWKNWPPLNGALLSQAAQAFIGRHDFSAFGRAMKPGNSTVREVFESAWTSTENGWRYEIKANAFLYHMVRRLVYLQVQFAKGSLTLADLKKGFDEKVIIKPGLAPSNGLVLTKVLYEGRSQGFVVDEN
jgi:tRNA pseudouridine38-40 synthase